MALLDEGDDAGALAELRRVYAIAPHPRVLYNIGLACAALGRPVEATEALDRLLAAPGALPAESLRRARAAREEQARRVAQLQVTTNVPGDYRDRRRRGGADTAGGGAARGGRHARRGRRSARATCRRAGSSRSRAA